MKRSPDPSAAVPAPAGYGAWVAGLLFVAVFAAIGRLASWRAELTALQVLMAAGFALMAWTLATQQRPGRDRAAPYVVGSVALAARLAVLAHAPDLSDDVFRYVWDGLVLGHGIDPYAHAPSSPVLALLRDGAIHPWINHPDLRTIYPPLAEAGFALVARISAGVTAMKAWMVLHDMVLVAVLLRACERAGRSPYAVAAYAWNPLVILEYAGHGHQDVAGMLYLVLALVWLRERPARSALAFSAAVLTKLVPLVALPFLWRAWPARARVWSAVTLVPGLACFVWLARGPGSGLEAYARQWRNNELAFHYAATLLGDARARVLVAVVTVGVIVWLLGRARPPLDDVRAVLRTSLLAGPVLHPWYLGWALAFEPWRPSAWWLALSATAMLNYGVPGSAATDPAFHLSLPWRWVEYTLPLFVWFVVVRIRARRAQGGI